jgi:hypothetical protein
MRESRSTRIADSAPTWLRSAATNRLPYKGAAIFLALVLWLVVAAEEPTSEYVPVELVLTLDSTLSLGNYRPPHVSVQVVGSAREVGKLQTAPPVLRRRFDAEVEDSVRVELSPSEIDLPPNVDVSIRDIQPRTFVVHFDTLAQRRLPVSSELRLVNGNGRVISDATATFDPESVTVVGRRQRVYDLQAVTTGRRTVVVEPNGITLVELANTPGLTITPSSVRLITSVPRDTVP